MKLLNVLRKTLIIVVTSSMISVALAEENDCQRYALAVPAQVEDRARTLARMRAISAKQEEPLDGFLLFKIYKYGNKNAFQFIDRGGNLDQETARLIMTNIGLVNARLGKKSLRVAAYLRVEFQAGVPAIYLHTMDTSEV